MATAVTEAELLARLATLPRLRLATLPTPLVEAPRLTAALGGPRLLIKRDDLTGVGFGGNKIREFEYSLAPALAQGCDILLNSAASQSNQSCQTAAVAARLGLRSLIIASADAHAQPLQGNLLLCRLFGAEVHLVAPDQRAQAKEALLVRLRAEGHRPYDTGYDGAVYRTVAYVDGFLELRRQLREQGVSGDAIYLCSGAHAHVGIALAVRALGLELPVVGVPYSPRYDDASVARRLAAGANEAAAVLGLDPSLGPQDIESHVEFTGTYGVPTAGALEAIRLAARTEGLVLDPVYTAKAMAALIAHIRRGRFRQEQTVVFLHTGGTPAIFAYSNELGLKEQT